MNENEVVKPITLLKEDFVQGLISLCNNSELPYFVIESILKDVYLEVRSLAKKQYEFDLEKYKKQLEERKQIKGD